MIFFLYKKNCRTLQEKCVELEPHLASLPFISSDPKTNEARIEMWIYLRTLAGRVMIDPINASTRDIAELFYDFLRMGQYWKLSLKSDEVRDIVQLHVWRLFRLDPLFQRIAAFVEQTSQLMNLRKCEQRKLNGDDLVSINKFIEDTQKIVCSASLEPLCLTIQSFIDHKQKNVPNFITKDGFEPVILVKECIRRQLEAEVYLNSLYPYSIDDIDEYQGNKIFSQEACGIKKKYLSPSNWKRAIEEIYGVRKHALPIDKLNSLVRTARVISEIYGEEHKGDVRASISADDFLPIFIYILASMEENAPKSEKRKNLEDLAQILINMCDDARTLGEMGYILASFEIAVQEVKIMIEQVSILIVND